MIVRLLSISSLFFASFFLLPEEAEAQNKPGTQLRIKRATGAIKLDGILDEPDWIAADSAHNWYLNYPNDTGRVNYQTEVRLTFDEHMFYVAFVCHDDPSTDLINSLRRDFDYMRNDNVGINIGPYNDKLNGFFFVITPKGVQMEGTISGGGNSDDSWNISWDNKWYSKVVRYSDKWIAELAIPFKSFRYKSNIREWNIAFDRLDQKRNQKSAWIQTPIQYGTGAFAYSGQLIWEDPVPPPHPNVSVIPYVAGASSADNTTEPKTKSSDLQVGFDAKVSVTPSLNLDLTVNPDFSQVEVDQQVINLTRFEFRFPERRQFFLENSDLFDKAGFPESRTFFSRRIGLVKDSTGLYTRVPIAFGARLSGSITPKWRISVMDMQTREKLSAGLPAQNYAVATVQRNFWKQSSISVTYADKESLHVGDADTTRFSHDGIFVPVIVGNKTQKKRNTSNRVITSDLELLSSDNLWYSSAYVSRSFDNLNSSQNYSAGAFMQHAGRKLNLNAGYSYVGKNFNAEAGYVPSHGVYPGQVSYSAGGSWTWYPRNSFVVLMGPIVAVNQNYLPNGQLVDKYYTLDYNFRFTNTSMLRFNGTYIYQRMTSDFNPIDASRYTSYLSGEKYNWNTVSATFQSNNRKITNFTLMGTYGGFYNGTNLNLNGQINFRYQPYGNVSMRFDYNDLRLPGNYGREKLFLIGPRFDVTFTDRIFLTTYVQYNKLLDNVNLNARFQWRYKPASDFFIVYTENYLPETMASKNRALVFKLTYWLNI